VRRARACVCLLYFPNEKNRLATGGQQQPPQLSILSVIYIYSYTYLTRYIYMYNVMMMSATRLLARLLRVKYFELHRYQYHCTRHTDSAVT